MLRMIDRHAVQQMLTAGSVWNRLGESTFLPAAPGGAGGAAQGADGALRGGRRGFKRLRYIRQPAWGLRRDALGIHSSGRLESRRPAFRLEDDLHAWCNRDLAVEVDYSGASDPGAIAGSERRPDQPPGWIQPKVL